jgi:hypothetical protein
MKPAPVRQMLQDGASIHDVLGTMPKRPAIEQNEVWSQGLTRIASQIVRTAKRSANTVVQHVVRGQIVGLFYDPLDVAETYCREELRRSRSREEGERLRQQMLMDILVYIGSAKAAGVLTLMDYPPAATYATQHADEIGAAS